MDYSVYSSVMTVLMLVAFLAIVAWAYDGRRRAQFEEASMLPFDEEAAPGQESTTRQVEGRT